LEYYHLSKIKSRVLQIFFDIQYQYRYYTAVMMTMNVRTDILNADRDYFIEQKKGHNLLWLRVSI
jgi:hypothetical protein